MINSLTADNTSKNTDFISEYKQKFNVCWKICGRQVACFVLSRKLNTFPSKFSQISKEISLKSCVPYKLGIKIIIRMVGIVKPPSCFNFYISLLQKCMSTNQICGPVCRKL